MKNKITLLILFSFAGIFTATSQIPNYVPSNGLVGWWPFNGNANDESGNGNNGTVNGATLTTDRLGNANKAYLFFNSNIQLPSTFSFVNSNGLTLSGWVKYNSIVSNPNYNTIIDISDGQCDNCWSHRYNIGQGNGSISFLREGSVVGACGGQLFATAPPAGSWVHIVGVIDLLNSNVLLYINGQLMQTSTFNGVSDLQLLSGGANSKIIGARTVTTNQNNIDGQIDDIGIWNRALTQQEVANLYNAQSCTSNTITADGPTTFCAGNSVNLKSDVVGGTYQWKKNGVNIATNSTSRTFKATLTGSYTCVATCNGTALTSNAIAITSKTNAAATVSASGATSFCAGDSVTLNATNLGSNYSVQWYRTNISMENATAYTQLVKQPGTYKVVTRNLTNGCSRISGSSVVVAVNCRLANPDVVVVDNELNDEAARTIREDMPEVIRIYPNPNEGSFTFEFQTDEEGAGDLQIINVMGQSIYNASVTSTDGFVQHQINLGNQFETGLYIVRYKLNGEQYDRKVILK
jgi:hypothetical protein